MRQNLGHLPYRRRKRIHEFFFVSIPSEVSCTRKHLRKNFNLDDHFDRAFFVYANERPIVNTKNKKITPPPGINKTVRTWLAAMRVTFPNPGTFPYICALHDEMGMVGQMAVT